MLTIYTKNHCPFCGMAKEYLESRNMEYKEINVDYDEQSKNFLIEQGHTTVPQIYENEKLFVEGGYDGLINMDKS